MNPWQQKFLDVCRSIIRFALWCAIVLNGLMLALFLIAFTAQFLWHLEATQISTSHSEMGSCYTQCLGSQLGSCRSERLGRSRRR